MEWKFRNGGKTENPKDAGIKEFSKHIFQSLVRESVQNSLDNPINDEPVIVEFNFDEVLKEDIPNYNQLENRLLSCYDYWKSETGYESLLKGIVERVNSFNGTIPIIKISDYNTKGMDISQNENIRKTKYFAFSRGNNSVHDNDDSGGSEGQGKAALFAVSALRTLFVHTVSKYGSIYEGLARFATHQIDEEDYGADGYLGNEPDSPKYEEKNIPSVFKRKNNVDFGTTISILGLWHFENAEEKMIKSALNNFWFAILDGDLIIRINELEINKENIDSLIDQYLPERYESNRTKSNPTQYGRAKCYFETWNEKFEATEAYNSQLPYLGHCTLKISYHPDFPGKIAFFRKQKMLIVRSSVNSYINKSYCGVFICTDDEGNKILRKMEGKTHTEWDPNFYTENVELGKKVIEELNKFIKKSWEDYRSKHFPETIDLKGLKGISLGSRGKSNSGTGYKKMDLPKPKEKPKPKPKPPFVKLGVINEGLSSYKKDGKWFYKFELTSKEDKTIKIIVLPATDAARVSKSEVVSIQNLTNSWNLTKENEFFGTLKSEEQNVIEFNLNSKERIGLNFKLSNYEI